jgi:uncharacterized membrane protein YhaH (DUF805 family)
MTGQKDMEKALASQKSYVGASVVTFLLYCVFYIPGLIVNVLYLRDAKKTAAVTGQNPSGYGCLLVLFVLGLLPLAIMVALFMMLMGVGIFGAVSGQ